MISRAFPYFASVLHLSLFMLRAEPPATRLFTVTPAGGKAGTTFDVSLAGQDLENVTSVRFSDKGITAVAKGTNQFSVTIEKSVAPATYEIRAVGKYGASNPRAFVAGLLNEVNASAGTSEAAPHGVPLESTINGRTTANAVDYYRFEAKKGQRVLVRCDAREIDSRLEPVLALHDQRGREVDHSRRGGLLDHRVTEDGTFTLRISDAIYRGGPEYFYRLSVGTFPHIDYIMPIAAGGAGESQPAKFAIYGRNLPGAAPAGHAGPVSLDRLDVALSPADPELRRSFTTLPAQAGLDLFEYRVRGGHGISDPALLRFPAEAVFVEQEPNNTAAATNRITIPCEVSGTFFPSGDRDWFSFYARKGEIYWIEVISHRLGLPTDPVVLIQRANASGAAEVLDLNDSEANTAGIDFNTAHRDPGGKLEVKEDGTYLLQIRDLFTHSPREVALPYQLVIRRPQPDFRLAALASSPLPSKKDAKDVVMSTVSLRQGETAPLKIVALRRDGYDGAIDLSVTNLPKGVTATAGRIEPGKTTGLVLLRCAADEPGRCEPIQVIGTGQISGTNMARAARAVSLTWNVADPANDPVVSRVSESCLLSTIAEPAAVRLTQVDEKSWAAVAGSKVRIPLKLERQGEVSATLKVKPVGAPALEALKETDLDPKSTNLFYELDLASQKIGTGTYVFALQALAQSKPKVAKEDKKSPAKETSLTLYSSPIMLTVTPAPPKTNSPAK